jgi:alpha-beta hydrolase superfamily lysophospholipase
MSKWSGFGTKVTEHEQIALGAADGHEIQVQIWRPSNPATQVIQVLHGLGEHAGRYSRFADSATARGCTVYCHDHRGHGKNADQLGSFGAKDGWNRVVSDVDTVHREIAHRHADLPIALIGHSMGSYIAQSYLIKHEPNISSLILSASTWPSRPLVLLARALAKIEGWRLGAHRDSALLQRLGFSNFNKPFHPSRTNSDWLSRDDAEVDTYIADPLCGGPYSAQLWSDLTAGLFSISSDSALRRIQTDLPILITGGELDPVGGDKGMGQLAMHYAQTGHNRLKVKIYPQGRHEMLNDTARDEVTRDWIDWIFATSRNARSS